MALGFCPNLLTSINALTECNSPMAKVTPGGFLKMLLETQNVATVKSFKDDGMGHIRDVSIKYAPRFLDTQTSTTPSCDIANTIAYTEQVITDPTLYRTQALYISASDMSKYCADASKMTSFGGQPVMTELVEQVKLMANSLLTAINKDLLTKQASNFGRNVRTGANTATPLNLPLSTTTNDLSQGVAQLLSDLSNNENCGDFSIVGSGLFENFTLQQFMNCCSSAGIDMSKFTNYKFYNDIFSQTIWGANQIGVFTDKSVQLIDINRNTLSGLQGNMGNSTFFTVTLPVSCCSGGYEALTFDAQLRAIDCPTLIGGQTRSTGWQLILGKSFDLWNIPANSYQAADRLFQNNGTYRYTITNA